MGMMRADLIKEIDAFKLRTGQSDRTISTAATSDSGLISRLRHGRHITTLSGERLQNYMREFGESASEKVKAREKKA
jgi:hypothetical protein